MFHYSTAMNWTARPLLHRGVVVNISKSTINNYVNCIPSTSPWETHRRNMAERASGPGGRFFFKIYIYNQSFSSLKLGRCYFELQEINSFINYFSKDDKANSLT